MMRNFQNYNLLLDGYEDYDCYLDMQNIDENVYANLIFYIHLDRQYPGSKFILNTCRMDKWIRNRQATEGYLQRYMKATHTKSPAEAIEKWRAMWILHHKQVLEYFGDRVGKDLLVLDMDEDEPINLYMFLCDTNQVMYRFLELYSISEKQDRFHVHLLNRILPDRAYHFLHIATYCIYLEERLDYVQTTLRQFGLSEVLFFRGLRQEHDLTPHDYQLLSTTTINTTIYPRCGVCNSASLHRTIYKMPTKLRVHLSYMFCLYHALTTQTYASHVLIFEDDVYFKVSLEDMHDTIHEFIERDMDVLYLGFCYCRNGNTLEPITPASRLILLPPNQSLKCKHAILYKKSYLERMLRHLLPLTFNSDIMFNHANIELKAKVCIPRKPVVFQDRERFDSQNGNPHASTESDSYLYR